MRRTERPNGTEMDRTGPDVGTERDGVSLDTGQSGPSRPFIGGQLHYDLLLDRARLVNRPSDPAGMRAAAIELRAQGLKPHDIGKALDISEAAVEQLLQER